MEAPSKFGQTTTHLVTCRQRIQTLLNGDGLPGLTQNFQIRYRSGHENANADALFRRIPKEVEDKPAENQTNDLLHKMSPSHVPSELQVACTKERLELAATRSHHAVALQISSFPSYSQDKLRHLQQKDPTIKRFSEYFNKGKGSSSLERKLEPHLVLVLFRQTERVVEVNGVLFRKIIHNVVEIKQLLLPVFFEARFSFFTS